MKHWRAWIAIFLPVVFVSDSFDWKYFYIDSLAETPSSNGGGGDISKLCLLSRLFFWWGWWLWWHIKNHVYQVDAKKARDPAWLPIDLIPFLTKTKVLFKNAISFSEISLLCYFLVFWILEKRLNEKLFGRNWFHWYTADLDLCYHLFFQNAFFLLWKKIQTNIPIIASALQSRSSIFPVILKSSRRIPRICRT